MSSSPQAAVADFASDDWPDDPLEVLRAWLPSNDDPARPLMSVATVDASGAPDARTQLLTAWDEHGLYFHTDSRSRKVEQLRGEPRVALCLHLPADARQITVQGTALPAAEHELEWAYAHRSPYLQQLAWQNDASFAALPLSDRIREWEQFAQSHADELTAPETWTGYVVYPTRLTFWVGSTLTASRRTEYNRIHDGWAVSYLAG